MSNEDIISLVAVGDVCFYGSVESEFKNSGTNPFTEVLQILHSSDLTFCNLESPLTESKNKQRRHYSKVLDSDLVVHLKSNPVFGKILKQSNFNIVSIANNHILDYYEEGLLETIKVLNNEKISFVGAGSDLNEARKAYFFEKNDIKIAFLSYSYTYEATSRSAGAAPLWKDIMLKDLENVQDQVDHVIVSLHFGIEFSSTPSTSEKELAHLLIDNGADIILGHHPHVLRGIEHYKNGIIAYSLGNFLFDTSISKVDTVLLENIRQSAILKLKIAKKEVFIDNIYPVYLSEEGIPCLSPEEKQSVILDKLNGHFVSSSGFQKYSIVDVMKSSCRKLFLSFKLIYASIKIGEFKNIYLIFKRYLNLI